MVNTIDLKTGKLKYWNNELPPIKMDDSLCDNVSIKTKCGTFKHTQVALELLLCKNASYYGLLGCEYFPEPQSDVLKIMLDYKVKNEIEYKNTILNYNEKVYTGLTEYYLSYIREHIKNYLRKSTIIPGGLLHFNVAANSEVGSSPNIFCSLSEMLIQMIINNNLNHNMGMDGVIKEMFNSTNLVVKKPL